MVHLDLTAARNRGAARVNLPVTARAMATPAYHRTREAPQAQRLGAAASKDEYHNCLTCQRYNVCADPMRSFNYRCTRWQEVAAMDDSFMNTGSTVDAIKASTGFQSDSSGGLDVLLDRVAEREQETNLSKMLDEALASGVDVPPDLRIDDRDVPAPPNYFQWVRGKQFSGMEGDLFPMQHKIMVEYHGEYCPRCSDVRFLDEMHVNSSIDEFEDRIVFLVNGKCPNSKCGATKSELVAAGELKEFYTLNGVAGQRGGKCIGGESIVLTREGPRRIADLCHGLPEGYTPRVVGMVQSDGTVRETSHLYVEGKRRLYTATMWNGLSLSGTACHPIQTDRGWTKLPKLRPGEAVPVQVGQNVWSSRLPSLKGVAQRATAAFESFVTSTRNHWQVKHPATYYTGALTPDIARFLGYYTAEGRGDRCTVTCHDPVILDELAATFETLFGFAPGRSDVDITDSSRHVGEYLDDLFDGRFFGGHSARKRVPNIIMRAPRELVCEYLRALFEGDGGLEKDRMVTYTSISKTLVHEVSALLNNLGVIHSISTGWTWATNGSDKQVSKRKYTIAIDGLLALEQFAAAVGFTSERKQSALASALTVQRGRQINMPFWYDKYPPELKQRFLTLNEQIWTELRRVPNPSVPGKWLGRQSVFDRNHTYHRINAANVALSRGRILMFVNGLGGFRHHLSIEVNVQLDWWENLARDTQRYYTTVAGVEREIQKRQSYDVSVPETHQFMANGLANHNTAVINVSEGYQLARWAKLPNPQRVFGTLSQQVLVATYCALTFGQVRANLWDPFVQFLSNSPWFKNYHGLLDYFGAKYGEELYQFKDVYLRYRHRGLYLLPSGPNKRTMRGATRFCFGGDTLVNSDGGLVPIADTTLAHAETWALNKAFPVAQHLSHGLRPVVKMTNELGVETVVTPGHHFVVWRETERRFKKIALDALLLTDSLVVQLGGSWPGIDPELPAFDPTVFEGHRPYLHLQVLDRMCSLEEFTYLDFEDLCPNRNQFYVYSSALRRVGLLETTFLKAASVAGQPRSTMKFDPANYEQAVAALPTKDSSFGRRRRDHIFPTEMSPSLAFILGCLISDGKYCYDSSEFTFTSVVRSHIDQFAAAYQATFHSEVRVNGPYRASERHQDYWEVRIAYASVKTFFRGLGLAEGDWSLYKRVPRLIFQSSQASVIAFIRGLWVGDGIKDGRGYVSICKALLLEIQQLLFKLGVVTRLGVKQQTPNDLYSLSLVSAFDVGKLKAVFGSDCPLQSRFECSGNGARHSGLIRHYALPGLGVVDRRSYGGTIFEKVWLDTRLDKLDGYKQQFALHELYKSDPETARHITPFLAAGFALTKVRAVEHAGFAAVYDLSIDNRAHVFTANGMLVSNSAVVDELGWFPFGDDNQDNTKMSAEEIHQSLENSLATLQAKHETLLLSGHNNLPKPLMSNISSPSELNDLIMKLHRASIGSSSAFTFKLATWEMNPNLPKHSAFIKRKFETDPDKAARDFGAEPPMSSAAWITEIKNAEGVFTGPKNNVMIRQFRFTSRSGLKQTTAESDIRVRSSGGRVMALDAGYVNNSFAFAIGKLSNGVPVIESFGEVIPSMKAPVSFTSLYEGVLKPLAAGCGVQFVVSDRWQNIMLLQMLEKEVGVVPVEMRVKYPDFEDLRERIYDHNIILPRLELPVDKIVTQQDDYPSGFMMKPAAHLMYQMFTVRDYPGKGVEKGAGATDDLFRAVVLSLKALNDPDIAGLLNEDGARKGPRLWGAVSSLTAPGRTVTAMGTAGGRSGIGGGGGGAAGAAATSAGASGSRR